MVRLGSVAMILFSLPAAVWSAPRATAQNPDRTRSFHMPQPDHHANGPDAAIGRTQIAPNTHFGFGIFGLNSERSHLRPATGREIDARKQRRAAVGFSLQF